MSGTIFARIAMGVVCDTLGPRLGMSAVLLLTAAPTFGIALAHNHLQFILLRFGIGFGLATFVTCQFWVSCMFNVRIVGTANATAGGWGNMGGGAEARDAAACHIVLPVCDTPCLRWVETSQHAADTMNYLHSHIMRAQCTTGVQETC